MSFQLIGVEGTVSPDAVVTWGAGAIRRLQMVVNTVTRRQVSIDEANRLAADGHLHLIANPLPIRDEQFESPLIVVLVRLQSPLHRLFLFDHVKAVGIAKAARTEQWQYYVFEERDAFDGYARGVATAVMRDIADQTNVVSGDAVDRNRLVVRNALALAPGDPDLNALRVFLSPTNVVEQIARSSIRTDFDQRRFQRTLTALRRSGDDRYELKYEHGAASGGGMDVDVAAQTLQAINRAARIIHSPIKQQYPYLHDIPSPRFKEMRAASAHLVFVSQANNQETLGNRIARYLSLQLLEDAVAGQLDLHDPEEQRNLETAVRKIVQPAPNTTLRHKPLSQPELLDVTPSAAPPVESIRGEQMDLFALISGLADDSEAEVQLFPALRVFVSTEDDGDKETPRGANAITRDGSFLRRPCLVSLVRESTEGTAPRFFLRRLRLLAPGGRATVTALPSSVVPDAFMVGLRIHITYSGNGKELSGDLGEMPCENPGGLDTARTLMESFSAAAQAYELEHARNGRWIRPTKSRAATPLARVLVVLASRNGAANVSVIRKLVEQRFGATVRGNNTRREVLKHPELLEFDAEDGQLVRWTERGERYYEAYVGAGGETQTRD